MKDDINNNPAHESILRSIYQHELIKIPSYFYHSTLISVYSLLETTLNLICEEFIQTTSFPLTLKHFAGGNIIDKSKVFLSKVASLDMSKVNKQWVEITKFQKLRNFIVHQNCILQLDSKDGKIKSNQINLLNGIGNIKIDTNDGTFILLNSKPILNFLNHIDEFIHEIIMQLGENSYPDFDDIFRTREHYGDNLPF